MACSLWARFATSHQQQQPYLQSLSPPPSDPPTHTHAPAAWASPAHLATVMAASLATRAIGSAREAAATEVAATSKAKQPRKKERNVATTAAVGAAGDGGSCCCWGRGVSGDGGAVAAVGEGRRAGEGEGGG